MNGLLTTLKTATSVGMNIWNKTERLFTESELFRVWRVHDGTELLRVPGQDHLTASRIFRGIVGQDSCERDEAFQLSGLTALVDEEMREMTGLESGTGQPLNETMRLI